MLFANTRDMTLGTTSRRVAASSIFALLVLALVAFPPARAFLHTAARGAGFVEVPKAVRTGDPFPSLALFDLDGRSVSVGAADSGTIVYNVFATWCSPCREETPELKAAAQTLSKRGVKFVGIDQGEPSSAVTAFVAEFGLGYPIVVDSNLISKQMLGARVIPETIVVRDGIVRSISVGPLNANDFERLVSIGSAT